MNTTERMNGAWSYIEIPFHDHMKKQVWEGKKSCTSRTKRYGKVGDRFRIGIHQYRLTGIMKRSLDYVATKLWREEGFESEQAFVDFWNMLHPSKLFDPDQLVYVHFFEPVEA
jgi:hypothetical protein